MKKFISYFIFRLISLLRGDDFEKKCRKEAIYLFYELEKTFYQSEKILLYIQQLLDIIAIRPVALNKCNSPRGHVVALLYFEHNSNDYPMAKLTEKLEKEDISPETFIAGLAYIFFKIAQQYADYYSTSFPSIDDAKFQTYLLIKLCTEKIKQIYPIEAEYIEIFMKKYRRIAIEDNWDPKKRYNPRRDILIIDHNAFY